MMSESTPRFLLKSEGKIVYVKSFNDKVLALYEDGNLKSTISMQKSQMLFLRALIRMDRLNLNDIKSNKCEYETDSWY